jgi:proteasome accessory factor B
MTMTVLPMKLAFMGRAWYVIAWSLKDRQLRTLKLGRIRKLTVTERHIEPPAEANVEEHFGDAWSMIPEGKVHDVRLWFSPKVAGNVAEVHWHRSQQVKWNDDGSIEFGVRVDGLGEITWWILGYGDQVEVLEPPELRRGISEIAARMAQRHQGQVQQ